MNTLLVRLKFTFLQLFFFILPTTFTSAFGETIKINDHWKFILGDVQNGASIEYNDSKWQNISLPHDWSVKGQLSPTLASCTGYLPGGIGWYRKTMEVPLEKKGEKVYLYFEGVYNRSEVYLNGQLLGKRPNGYISFMYDATPFIKYGEKNVIAVRVDHSQYADSRWYTGSGIYRDVWMIYANPIHIAQWGVYAYPEEVRNGYKLNLEVNINNGEKSDENLTIVNELFAADGRLITKSRKKVTVKPGDDNKIQYKKSQKVVTDGP
jgi:beta-galactosidase/beta-glucuronidase